MTQKHWVRDVLLPFDTGNYHGNQHRAFYVMYHFLRTCGWENIWECDSRIHEQVSEAEGETNPNTCPDGDMEAVGVASWTVTDPGVLGSSREKSTDQIYYGAQALKVTLFSEYNAGAEVKGRKPKESYVNSSNILYPYHIIDSGHHYKHQCRFRVFNNSGKTLKARMFGGGVNENRTPSDDGYTDWINLTSTGDWQEYQIEYSQFSTITGDTADDVRLEILLPEPGSSVHSAVFYLDMVHTYRALFERPDQSGMNLVVDGTDGVIANGDEISAASYTFTASDVGSFVAVYDPDNPGNSGVYPILSISGASAVLDLRSGTASLTSASGRTFRVFPLSTDDLITDRGRSAGFGLKSPHTSGFRVFFRLVLPTTGARQHVQMWACPDDVATFHPINAAIDLNGPSTQNSRTEVYDYSASLDNIGNRHATCGTFYNSGDSPTDSHLYLMTDSLGAFLSFFHWDSYTVNAHGVFALGYLGSSALRPNEQSFAVICRWDDMIYGNPENQWINNNDSFSYNCTTFDHYGYAVRCILASMGLGTVATTPFTQGGGPNPFSGEEWLVPLYVLVDPFEEYGSPGAFIMDTGHYRGRTNLPDLAPFGGVVGEGDSLSFSTPTVTLTDSAGLFTSDMVGKDITISDATNPGNNGTFTVASYISATQITYTNASGVTETSSFHWAVAMNSYLHFSNGYCWEWSGEAIP